MKYLVLAHPQDETALRVGAALRRRHGRELVRIVSAEALALAPVFVHQLEQNDSGQLLVETELILPDGDRLDFRQPGVVFNRLELTIPPQFASASRADQDYAAQELNALWMSWLHSLGQTGWAVVNPVTGRGLQARLSQLEWKKMILGIQRQSPDDGQPAEAWEGVARDPIRMLAAGDQLVRLSSPWPDVQGLKTIVSSLQLLSGFPLLELTIQPDESGWRLLSVESFPHFSAPDAVAAVTDYLSDLV